MRYRRILVTGGAGFVGSSLSMAIKRDHADCEVIAVDNLKRRGSELALPRLKMAGVAFHHGDIRCRDDLNALGAVDLMIDCAAEPSVQAGYGHSPAYVVNTNLAGTAHCLDYLRDRGGDLLFLSTSRVYPIAGLRRIPLERRGDRWCVDALEQGLGWSAAGITEDFPLVGARSLYGATKYASEILIEEYRAIYGLRAMILRCGVIAGPWQMGRVDQGFMALWMARHLFGGSLSYRGFGGKGLQVRDVLHVADLYALIDRMLVDAPAHDGVVYNVGGGADVSLSLHELTAQCRLICGKTIEIGIDSETMPADVPYYVTDCHKLRDATGWCPQHAVSDILGDIHQWLVDNRTQLEPMFSG